MKIKNIWTETKYINVNQIKMNQNQIMEFPQEFKKTSEFKKLVTHKYIEEVTK